MVQHQERGRKKHRDCRNALLRARILWWKLWGSLDQFLDFILPVSAPTSTARLCWSLWTLVMAIYAAVDIPLLIAFEPWRVQGVVTIMAFIVSASFSLDIIVQFRTAYMTPRGELVRAPRLVAGHYLRTMFLLDFLSALPMDEIVSLLSQGKAHEHAYWVGLLRLPRLFILLRHVDRMTPVRLAHFVMVARLLCGMLLITHYFACLWYYLFRKIAGIPWVFSVNCVDWAAPDIYLFAFYRCFLMILGDRPLTYNNVERGLAVALLFFGACLYAIIMSSMTLVISNMWSMASRHKQRSAMVQDALRYQGADDEVRIKVNSYFDFMAVYNHPGGDGVAMLAELPASLHAEAMASVFEPMITRVQLFTQCDRPFLWRLAQRLRLVLYMAGDVIYVAGSVGHEMYFVWQGAVGLVEADGCMGALMSEGDHFGELGLMAANTPRPHRAVALRHTDLMVLTRWDLQDVMKDFPESAELVKGRARVQLEDHEISLAVWMAMPTMELQQQGDEELREGANQEPGSALATLDPVVPFGDESRKWMPGVPRRPQVFQPHPDTVPTISTTGATSSPAAIASATAPGSTAAAAADGAATAAAPTDEAMAADRLIATATATVTVVPAKASGPCSMDQILLAEGGMWSASVPSGRNKGNGVRERDRTGMAAGAPGSGADGKTTGGPIAEARERDGEDFTPLPSNMSGSTRRVDSGRRRSRTSEDSLYAMMCRVKPTTATSLPSPGGTTRRSAPRSEGDSSTLVFSPIPERWQQPITAPQPPPTGPRSPILERTPLVQFTHLGPKSPLPVRSLRLHFPHAGPRSPVRERFQLHSAALPGARSPLPERSQPLSPVRERLNGFPSPSPLRGAKTLAARIPPTFSRGPSQDTGIVEPGWGREAAAAAAAMEAGRVGPPARYTGEHQPVVPQRRLMRAVQDALAAYGPVRTVPGGLMSDGSVDAEKGGNGAAHGPRRGERGRGDPADGEDGGDFDDGGISGHVSGQSGAQVLLLTPQPFLGVDPLTMRMYDDAARLGGKDLSPVAIMRAPPRGGGGAAAATSAAVATSSATVTVTAAANANAGGDAAALVTDDFSLVVGLSGLRSMRLVRKYSSGLKRGSGSGVPASSQPPEAAATISSETDRAVEEWLMSQGCCRSARCEALEHQLATALRQLQEAREQNAFMLENPFKVPALALVLRREVETVTAARTAQMNVTMLGLLDMLQSVMARADELTQQMAAADEKLQRLEEEQMGDPLASLLSSSDSGILDTREALSRASSGLMAAGGDPDGILTGRTTRPSSAAGNTEGGGGASKRRNGEPGAAKGMQLLRQQSVKYQQWRQPALQYLSSLQLDMDGAADARPQGGPEVDGSASFVERRSAVSFTGNVTMPKKKRRGMKRRGSTLALSALTAAAAIAPMPMQPHPPVLAHSRSNRLRRQDFSAVGWAGASVEEEVEGSGTGTGASPSKASSAAQVMGSIALLQSETRSASQRRISARGFLPSSLLPEERGEAGSASPGSSNRGSRPQQPIWDQEITALELEGADRVQEPRVRGSGDLPGSS